VDSFCSRITGTYDRLIAEARNRKKGPLVTVAHGGVGMALFYTHIDHEHPFFSHFMDNCGVFEFIHRFRRGGPDIRFLGSPWKPPKGASVRF
jgi:broad specificity phosphatase PhoE